MSVTTYPISRETVKHLERPLFGHVVDNDIVPSADGRTLPVIDPATGAEIAVAARGSAVVAGGLPRARAQRGAGADRPVERPFGRLRVRGGRARGRQLRRP